MLRGETLTAQRVQDEREELIGRVRAQLGDDAQRLRVRYELRYRGQSFELGVEQSGSACVEQIDVGWLRESFARAHEERYGYRDERAEIELVTMRASAWGAQPTVQLASGSQREPARGQRYVILDGQEAQAAYLRGEPVPGTRVLGPAIWALGESTLWIPPDWDGEVDPQGTVKLTQMLTENEGSAS
jgi:N-methylhydantoinase A